MRDAAGVATNLAKGRPTEVRVGPDLIVDDFAIEFC
jgi:hypothetical protein